MPRKNFTRRLSGVEPLERRLLLFNGFNPTVTLETNFGDIEFELFEDEAPGSVENFLNYINDGDYIDGFFHRLVPGFVLQGGGFTTTDEVFLSQDDLDFCSGDIDCQFDNIDPDTFDIVPTDPPIVNEPGISNTRGTVAFAKLGGNPDSATNQFFVNLSDNSANLDAQNGGFTVFAQVNDLTTVDRIAALAQADLSSIFTTPGQAPLTAASAVPFEETDDGLALVQIQDVSGTSLVHGTVFDDGNGNGILDGAEVGQSGVVVFDDTNGNGIADAGEQQTTTDETGQYHLTFPGEHTYNITTILSNGALRTTSQNIAGSLEIGQSAIGVDFGVALPPATAFHNAAVATDVNGDGIVAPIDALQVINELNTRVFSSSTTGLLLSSSQTQSNPIFLDINDDGVISATDAIIVINELNGASTVDGGDTGGDTGGETLPETEEEPNALVGTSVEFNNFFHDISGTLTVLDNRTLQVTDFTYDGLGPSVYFYTGTDGGYNPRDGGNRVGPRLDGRVWNGETITIDLPANVTLDDFNGLSVWCDIFDVDFGSANLPDPSSSASSGRSVDALTFVENTLEASEDETRLDPNMVDQIFADPSSQSSSGPI